MAMTDPFSPPPNPDRCQRHIRNGNHTWRHLPPYPVICVRCGRRPGRRYAKP